MYKICIYNYDEVALNSQDMTIDTNVYEPTDLWRAGLVTAPSWVTNSTQAMLDQLNDGSGGNTTPYLDGLNEYIYLDEDPEHVPIPLLRSSKISYLVSGSGSTNIAASENLSYSSGSSQVDYSTGSSGLLFDEDHGLCIYDDETITSFDKLTEPSLKLSDSAAGTLEFTVPLDNIGYGKMKRMITVVSVFQNHKEIFSGRVLSEEDDFWGRQKICVEGELSYLNDTTQPPAIINGTPREYIQVLLDRHNAKVRSTAPFKQFQLGVVNVDYDKLTEKYGDANEWTTNFESTLDLINTFVDDLEGHMEVIKSDGIRTLNIYSDWPRTSSQAISFGNNLIDFTQKYDMSELATVLIPLGKLEDQLAKGDEVDFLYDYYGHYGCQVNKVGVSPKDGFAIYDASNFCTRMYTVFTDQTIIDNCQSLNFTYSTTLPSGFIEYAVFDANGNCITTTTADGNGKVDYEVSIQNTARYVFVSSYHDATYGKGVAPILNLVGGQTYSEEYWTTEEKTRDEIVNPNTNPPTTATVVYDTEPVKANRDVTVWFDLNPDQYWGCLIREHNLINNYGTVTTSLGIRNIDGVYNTYGPIPVEEGKKYYYSARCDEKFCMYAFTDGEGVLKDSKSGQECFDDTQHNDVEDELITAPKSAAYLYFTSVSDRFHLWEYNDLYDKLEKSLTVETAVVNSTTGETYGSYYVINENAVRNFGWIEKIVKFDDITDATDLLRRAKIYLESEQFDQLEINITALDLVQLGANIDSLHLLDSVQCISEPHGLNKYFPIREIDLPLDKPDSAKYTLGEDLKLTLTDTSWDANADLQAQIEAIPSKQSVLESAKEQATAVMRQYTRGYVTIADTDRYGTCIYISDREDYTQARRMWLWNLNGLGYSKDGGETFDLAITMDGAIVADFITAGTMSADRVRTGKIIDVNGYNWWDLSSGELVIGHNHAWVETRGLDENGNLTAKRESLEEYSVNQYKIFKELFGVSTVEGVQKRRVNGIRGVMTKISDQEELYEYQLYISASQISSGVLMSDTDSFFFDLHNGTLVSTAQYRGFSNDSGTVTETGPSFDKFLQFLYCSVLGFTGGTYQPTKFNAYDGTVSELGGIVGIDPETGEATSAELNGALDLAQTYPDGKHVTLASKNSIILSYGDTFYVEKGDVVTGEIAYSDDTDKRDGYVVNNSPREFVFGETELFEGDGTKFQFDIDVRLNNQVVIGYDKNDYENPYPDVYIPISSGSLEVRGNTTLGRSSAMYESNEVKTLKKKKQAYNPETGKTEYIYATVDDPDNPGQTKKEYVYEYYDKPYKQKHYLDKVQINGDVNVTGTIKTSSIDIDDTISLNHVIAKKCIKVGQDFAGGFFDDCVWETDSEMLEIQGYDSSSASKKANNTNVFCGANLFYDSAAFYGSGGSDSTLTGYGIIEYLLGPHKLNTSKDYDNLSTRSDVSLLEELYQETEADIQSLVDATNPATSIKKYRLVTEGGILTVGDSKFFGAFAVAQSPNHTFQVYGVPGDYTDIEKDEDIKEFDTTLVSGKAKVIYLSINQEYSGFGIYDILLNGFVKITCKLTLDAPLEVNERADFNGSLHANGLSFFEDEAEFHDAIMIVKVTGTGDQQDIEEIITLNKPDTSTKVPDRSIKVHATENTSVISIGYTKNNKEYYANMYASGVIETTGRASFGGDISGTGLFKLTKTVNSTDFETIVISNTGSVTITDYDSSGSSSDANSQYILIQNNNKNKYVKLLSDGIIRATGSGLFEGSLKSGAAIYIEQKINGSTDTHKSFNVANTGSITVTSYNEATANDTIEKITIQNKSGDKYVILQADGVIKTTGAGEFGGYVEGTLLRVKKTSTTSTYTFKVTNDGDVTAKSLTLNNGAFTIYKADGTTVGFTIGSSGDLEANSAAIKGRLSVKNSSGTETFWVTQSGELNTNSAILNGGRLSIKNSSGTEKAYVTSDGAASFVSLLVNGNSPVFWADYINNSTTYSHSLNTESGALNTKYLFVNGTLRIDNNGYATVAKILNTGAYYTRTASYSNGSYTYSEVERISSGGAGTFTSVKASTGFFTTSSGSDTCRISSTGAGYFAGINCSSITSTGSINCSSLTSTESINCSNITSTGTGSFKDLSSNGSFSVCGGEIYGEYRYFYINSSYSYHYRFRSLYGAQIGWDGYSFASYLYGDIYINNNYVSTSDGTFVVSDANKKHDIKELTFSSLDYVKKIRAKSFRWNKNNHLVPAGFIAQEVAIIDEQHDDEDTYSPIVARDSNDDTQMIDYNKLTAILWEAVYELSKKVDELTSKLEAMK